MFPKNSANILGKLKLNNIKKARFIRVFSRQARIQILTFAMSLENAARGHFQIRGDYLNKFTISKIIDE
ncbi:hypothetical protein BN2497_12739 [Janthinobacterium sp. CG23_2]|nr:hypothetical protein BN2497_12739 [Janthinobacterium sp. CG23_2]CUU32767.1 hypothetical protein BN3177_12739 [Janthinobacterium sp. CG23_2]